MKSILGKILTYLGGAVLAAILCVAVITTSFVSNTVMRNENTIMRDDSEKSTAYIDKYFNKYINMMQQISRDKNVVKMLSGNMAESTYQQSPYYTDVYSMLQETAVSDKENILTVYIAKDIQGSNVDFAFDNEGWTSDSGFDLDKKNYWFTNQENIDKGFIICEPYYDESNGNMVTTISAPVYKNSQMIGIAAVDIKVTTICDMVANAKSTYKQGYRILISNEGYILAHKNQDDILKKYDEIGLDKTLLDGINKVADKVVNFKDSGSDAYAVIGQENSSGWKIVNIIPSAEYKKSTNAVGLTIIIINVIAIILIISIMYIIAKSISNPLKNLTKTTDKLAAGDLDVSIDVRSKDEVGKLAQSMSVLVNRLKDYIAYINEISDLLEQIGNGNLNLTFVQSYDGDFKKVKDALIHSSDMLSYTLSECNVAAGQVTSGSEQVAVGAQALSQGATEQASSIEELSSTMEDISNKIKENAVKSNQASKYSNEAAEEVILSNQKMKEMSQAMADITEKSNEIGKIIKTIDDIAFQTNILALNAAVEAARAGVAGKGFAVVADEVRNLAAKSAEAAKNTTSLIEGTIEAVSNGGKITSETAEALAIVEEKAGKVSELINEISGASNGQATAVSQVTLGIEQISAVVQTNSATAEESAAASEELSSQAQLFKDLIGKFNLKDKN